MRILVIEAADSVRSMIETFVSAGGHEVEAVASGAKGIDSAMARPPEAILVDVDLPTPSDGLEVCRKLRAEGATREVPIMAISEHADDASKERALEAGASAYYTKPFSPTALLKELESIGARESTKIALR